VVPSFIFSYVLQVHSFIFHHRSVGPELYFSTSMLRSCRAPVRFFIPSQAPVSRNGLMHTCRHAYFCFQRGLEPGKGASCYPDKKGKYNNKPPAMVTLPRLSLIRGRCGLIRLPSTLPPPSPPPPCTCPPRAYPRPRQCRPLIGQRSV
jgi:hypothetical protein